MTKEYTDAEVAYINTGAIVEGITSTLKSHPERIETNPFLHRMAEQFIIDLETRYQLPPARISHLRARLRELN